MTERRQRTLIPARFHRGPTARLDAGAVKAEFTAPNCPGSFGTYTGDDGRVRLSATYYCTERDVKATLPAVTTAIDEGWLSAIYNVSTHGDDSWRLDGASADGAAIAIPDVHFEFPLVSNSMKRE